MEKQTPASDLERRKKVRIRLRGDLGINAQKYEGRTYYVVKDPISLQYFRMTDEDYFLATLFDGRRTFGQVRQAYLQRFPHARLDYTPEELNERVLRFANDLAMLQFLSVQGMRLKARYEAQKKHKKKKGGLYGLANQVFFFRFSLFDPDKLFGKLAKPFWWIWTPQALWISIGIIALGFIVFMQHAEGLDQALANIFHWENIALMWITTILIKSVHELGHGLTCKHFGGEVHEVGFMSLIFTPYFFVNVTDSWVMPNRKHRMLVSAAGIYVELIFAAFAVFLWAIVQPGWFKDFLFNIILIASISTIIFNANPLMRFDGYYIMTDLIEVPNLQGKSRALIQHQVNRLIFGSSNKESVLSRLPLPRKRFWLFYTYAVLSWLYGYWVIYKLIIFMKPHLQPLGLEELSDWFAWLAGIGWVVVPLAHFVQQLQLTREDMKPGGRWRRIGIVFGLPLAAFLAFCFAPVELKIKRVCAIEIAEPEEVRPEVTGFVQEVFVKEGDRVTGGQLLARLENRELRQKLVVSEQRLHSTEGQLQRALGLDKPAEQQQLENLRKRYTADSDESRHDVTQLEIRAAHDGLILTRDLRLKVGHLLKSGELFCELTPLDPMRIKIPLNEKQVRYIAPGERVEFKANAYPNLTFQGSIVAAPLVPITKNMPAAFSAKRSGDVSTFIDREGHEVPVERVFAAQIDVQNSNALLRPGMTGRAHIHAGRRPFGKMVLQSLLDLVSLDYRF
ncbi:MAG TPA: efflux RND transporter periplasmic adaptor subunit [Chthoniobacteraceae bacterium]|nr:efflux RND transporter periplasmic adaptor subunit [Chthoniobacteraceae bacterium]